MQNVPLRLVTFAFKFMILIRIFFIFLLSNKIEWLGDTMGTRLRRLPVSSTCSLILMLHDTYENSNEARMLFESDLDIGFFDSNGFNERLYRNNYARLRGNHSTNSHIETVDLTIDDNPTHNHQHEITDVSITELLNINSTSPQSMENTDLVAAIDADSVEDNNITDSRRGGSSKKRGGKRGERGGSSRGSSSTSGNGGSSRRLRSQVRQNVDSNSVNDDNWSVLLPENMEDQVRRIRSKRRG